MATAASTLIQRTRRFLGDWPETDALTASASTSSSLTVADSSVYSPGWILQVDTEAMYVTALTNATTVAVRRGIRGTTAATHTSATTVLVRPHFIDIEYLDAINSGINAAFPFLYQPIVDESLTTSANTYEYTIPILYSGTVIPYLYRISYKETGDTAFRKITDWETVRGATPKIKFRRDMGAGTLRVQGFGPIAPLASLSDTLSTSVPLNAEDALTFYASQYLLASGEARRVREDTGARDDRETANRTGSSMSASKEMLSRFYARLQAAQMPPLPKNIQSVI